MGDQFKPDKTSMARLEKHVLFSNLKLLTFFYISGFKEIVSWLGWGGSSC